MEINRFSDEELLEQIEFEGLKIPRAFALHWREINVEKLAYISIKATVDRKPDSGKSNFGVISSLPLNFNYPKDSFGKYMYPLATINFREFPQLPLFPETGVLLFFISAFADYGSDHYNPTEQKDFRILFFEEDQAVESADDSLTILSFDQKERILPVFKPHYLTFELKKEFPGGEDIHYAAFARDYLLPIASRYPAIRERLMRVIEYCLYNGGHKIGGYAYFTQADPRSYEPEFKDYILLFQMDTDEHIMWGDAGVANFFIHPEDLIRKDFSKVLYQWDCG